MNVYKLIGYFFCIELKPSCYCGWTPHLQLYHSHCGQRRTTGPLKINQCYRVQTVMDVPSTTLDPRPWQNHSQTDCWSSTWMRRASGLCLTSLKSCIMERGGSWWLPNLKTVIAPAHRFWSTVHANASLDSEFDYIYATCRKKRRTSQWDRKENVGVRQKPRRLNAAIIMS